MNSSLKKVVVSGLTLAMVLGGSTAVFADGKGKGNNNNQHDDDNERGDRKSIQTKYDDSKLPARSTGNVNSFNGNVNSFNNVNIRISFDDVKGGDVEWASRYIASLASKRVFEGYEDGTFQPRRTITRIEAITAAVRLMGLRDQAESDAAKSANLNFKDADKLKEQYPWATGYVSVALQNDLFTESDNEVQPEKEADRLWATTLLVKAMKLQDQAKAKMNAKLTFKDANKIPAGSVGYVALAIEKKLIDGYEDNTFRPNNPVTRAELAALLDRTGSQLPDNTAVRGTVNAAVYNNVLSLTTNGQPYSVEIDPNAFIFRNGAKVAAADLRVNDIVIVRTYGGKAIFVEVTNANTDTSTDFTLTGTLNTYTLNTNGSIATITINQTLANGTVQTAIYTTSNLTIQGDLSLLTANRSIELRGKNQIVNTIVIR